MLTRIGIDALDVASLKTFWLEATQGLTGGLQLRFVETKVAKTGKNRLHLDLAADRTGWPRWNG
jgi:hypothetical protein